MHPCVNSRETPRQKKESSFSCRGVYSTKKGRQSISPLWSPMCGLGGMLSGGQNEGRPRDFPPPHQKSLLMQGLRSARAIGWT